MKIKCTKEEYTQMVAQCVRNFTPTDIGDETAWCSHCVLYKMCERWDVLDESVSPDENFLFLNDVSEIVDDSTTE